MSEEDSSADHGRAGGADPCRQSMEGRRPKKLLLTFQLAENPKLLEGQFITDDEGNRFEKQVLLHNARKHWATVRLVGDITSGLVHLSLEEYLSLPAKMYNALTRVRQYRNEKTKKEADEQRRR